MAVHCILPVLYCCIPACVIKMADIEALRAELEMTRATLVAERERSAALMENAAAALMENAAAPAPAPMIAADSAGEDGSSRSGINTEAPIFITPARRIDKFRGQITAPGDTAAVYEWVPDARGLLLARQIPLRGQAAVVVENLAGKARQEIIGRGDEVMGDPEQIFQILLRVFGDGDTLSQLQQRFFSYRQGANEDLVSCSLNLLQLVARMCQWDPSFNDNRDKMPKDRLAEAVRDESLRRELRRLNVEAPELGFFLLRDRALQWLGGSTSSSTRQKIDATQQEIHVGDTDLMALVDKQGETIKQLQAELRDMKLSTSSAPVSSAPPRLCWTCNSPQHFQRNCPRFTGQSFGPPGWNGHFQQTGPPRHPGPRQDNHLNM